MPVSASLSCFSNFNPRSREGSDGVRLADSPFLRHFNPRSREGSDVMVSPHIFPLVYFNPRSREGSDAWFIQPDA